MKHPRFSRRGLIAASVAAAAGTLQDGTRADQVFGPEWSKRKKYETVNGIRMAYYEVGKGDPIVFLHGNPTSSYLWRRVIPHVQHLGRCIAPDLVGMGDSQPLPNSGPGVYTFSTHRKYLFGLLEALGVSRNAILVIHDWGGALGFHWAHSNEERVKGIAYMETLLKAPGKDDSKLNPRGFFGMLRSEEGEKAVLEDNAFLNWFFKTLDLYLTDEDKAEYLRPFREPGESRRPTLTWSREVPVAGEPAGNAKIVSNYSAWLAKSKVPKLFVHAVPGMLFQPDEMLKFAGSLPNQERVRVYGTHFVQEVSGDAIGRALSRWIPTLTRAGH